MKKILLFILILPLPYFLKAQWIEVGTGFTADLRIQDIEAIDASTAWAVANSEDFYSYVETLDFTRTLDGTNWIAGTITNPDAANHSFSNISAISADEAWVAMYSITGGGGIFHTADGGITWEHQTTAKFAAPSGFPNVVHMFSTDSGFCMGDPNGGYFEIYTTIDGGDNWVRVPEVNISPSLSGEVGISEDYWVTGNTIWFGTQLGRVYKSTDKGYTWTAAITGMSLVWDIAFTDENNGIAIDIDEFKITADGGLTWNSASYTGNPRGFSAEAIPETNTIITCEWNLLFYFDDEPGSSYSTDHGTTWIEMDTIQ
ncbi:MAG: hypothetical protein H0W62_06070 [Chitinophagales bacterium]|nr:hypothetical protein [Chitinophagales bacterium]